MKENNVKVKEYVNNKISEMNEKYPNFFTNKDIDKITSMFLDSNDDFDVIKNNIDLVVKKYFAVRLCAIKASENSSIMVHDIAKNKSNEETSEEVILNESNEEAPDEVIVKEPNEEVSDKVITNESSDGEISNVISEDIFNSIEENEKNLPENVNVVENNDVSVNNESVNTVNNQEEVKVADVNNEMINNNNTGNKRKILGYIVLLVIIILIGIYIALILV